MERVKENVVLAKKAANKYCIVPGCDSSSHREPNKLFINVPIGDIRKTWLKQIRRDTASVSLTSHLYCCEGHFNLEEDLENYMRIKLDPSAKIRLKKGALPRFFNCQPDRKRLHIPTSRPAAKKLRTARILAEIEGNDVLLSRASTSSNFGGKHTVDSYTTESAELAENANESADSDLLSEDEDTFSHLSSQDALPAPVPLPKTRDVGTQMSLKRPKYCSVRIQCTILPEKPDVKDTSCSPVKFESHLIRDRRSSESKTTFSSNLNNTFDSFDEYLPTDDESEESAKCALQNKKLDIVKLRLERIEAKPKNYIGIPDHALFLVQLLKNETDLKIEDIYLTLEKIKINLTFTILGDEYNRSSSYASDVFRKSVPLLARYLKECIIWPSSDTIQFTLPLPFRARYSNVQSVIDCFEIEIQKPTNAIKQSLTWSEYKKCNTIKYLISSTPDGTINYISGGFGGRTSDALIIENCDFLQKLNEHCTVMADRGFKHIEPLLIQKNCSLVRPPSVYSSKNPTKHEVMETKRKASLRIHIKRVIRRLREFNFLIAHSGIPSTFMDIIDDIVCIAAALSNFQPPIINQG